MESDDAGLRTVGVTREQPKMLNTRIILRTGQPGQAPEADTIARYDINDYKTKSELTHARLYTTLTSLAIRSTNQLQRLDESRKAGEDRCRQQPVHCRPKGPCLAGNITQLAGLIGVAPEGCGLRCIGRGRRPPPIISGSSPPDDFSHLIQH